MPNDNDIQGGNQPPFAAAPGSATDVAGGMRSLLVREKRENDAYENYRCFQRMRAETGWPPVGIVEACRREWTDALKECHGIADEYRALMAKSPNGCKLSDAYCGRGASPTEPALPAVGVRCSAGLGN